MKVADPWGAVQLIALGSFFGGLAGALLLALYCVHGYRGYELDTVMTAIANDVGYQHVYARQVANLVKENDALIAVSTSGNSENLLRALKQAQKIGATTIALAGGNGGEMAKLQLDHCLIVESSSIHRVQECHVAIYHVLWDLVHTLLADTRGKINPKETGDEIR